jgi:hypothetical protein
MGDTRYYTRSTRDVASGRPTGSDFVHEIRVNDDGTASSCCELLVRLAGLHPDVCAVRIYGYITPAGRKRHCTFDETPIAQHWHRTDWLQTAFVSTKPDGTAEARIPVAFGVGPVSVQVTCCVAVHFYTAVLADSTSDRAPLSGGAGVSGPTVVLSLQAVSRVSMGAEAASQDQQDPCVASFPRERITPTLCGIPVARWIGAGMPTVECELRKPERVFVSAIDLAQTVNTLDHHDYDERAFILNAMPMSRALHAKGSVSDHRLSDAFVDQTPLGLKMFNRRNVPALLTGAPLPVEAHYLAHWMTAPAGGDPRAWEEALAVGALSIGQAPNSVTPASLAATLSLLTALAPYRTDRTADGKKTEIFAHKGVTVSSLASGDCEDGATSAIVLARALEYQRRHAYEHGSLVKQAHRVLDQYFVCAADCEINGAGGKKNLHACGMLLRRDVLYKHVTASANDHDTIRDGSRAGEDDRLAELFDCGLSVFVIESVLPSEPRSRPVDNDDGRSRIQARVSGLCTKAASDQGGLFDGVQFMRRSPGAAGYINFFRIYAPEMSFRVNMRSLSPATANDDFSEITQIGLGFDEMMKLGTREFSRCKATFVVTPDESGVRNGGSHVVDTAEELVLDSHVPVPPLRPTDEIQKTATSFPTEFFGAPESFFLFTRWFEDRSRQVDRIAAACGAKVARVFSWQNYNVHVLTEFVDTQKA